MVAVVTCRDRGLTGFSSVLSSQGVCSKCFQTIRFQLAKTMFADLDYDIEEDKL